MNPSAESPSFTRREFVAGSAALGAMFAVGAAAQTASTSASTMKDTYLVHHVFFWLKNPDSKEDLAALLDGIRGLGAIPQVKGIHVGVPADTEKREVVENSYHASEMLLFDSLADEPYAWWLLCSSSPPISTPIGTMFRDASCVSKLR